MAEIREITARQVLNGWIGDLSRIVAAFNSSGLYGQAAETQTLLQAVAHYLDGPLDELIESGPDTWADAWWDCVGELPEEEGEVNERT